MESEVNRLSQQLVKTQEVLGKQADSMELLGKSLIEVLQLASVSYTLGVGSSSLLMKDENFMEVLPRVWTNFVANVANNKALLTSYGSINPFHLGVDMPSINRLAFSSDVSSTINPNPVESQAKEFQPSRMLIEEANDLEDQFKEVVRCSRDIFNARVREVLRGKKGRRLNFDQHKKAIVEVLKMMDSFVDQRGNIISRR